MALAPRSAQPSGEGAAERNGVQRRAPQLHPPDIGIVIGPHGHRRQLCAVTPCIGPRRRATSPTDGVRVRALDRHAQRNQGVGDPRPDPRLLRLSGASAEDWRAVVDCLAPFLKEKRIRRLEQVLRRRRSHLHLVVENIVDPHNAASLLRTAESLGVQHVHAIESVSTLQLPSAPHPDRGSLGRTDGGEALRAKPA